MDQHPQRQFDGYADEVERYRRMVASTRSFTTPAVLTLVLYFVLWIPGLIANIVYLQEARKIQRDFGREPDGTGCLWALLVVFGGLGIVGSCIWILLIVGLFSSMGSN